MNAHRILIGTIAALSLALWVRVIIDTSTVLQEMHSIPRMSADSQKVLFTTQFTAIDKALSTTVREEYYEFNTRIEAPFRHFRPAPSGESPVSTPLQPEHSEPVREKLLLKGILLRATPFAILQDSNGKNHICKVGDSLYSQKVTQITRDIVTLRDSIGTYSLTRRH